MPDAMFLSRRNLIAGASLLGALGPARAAPTAALGPTAASRSGPVLAFIGSYTDASTPPGHGEGITALRLDTGHGRAEAAQDLPQSEPVLARDRVGSQIPLRGERDGGLRPEQDGFGHRLRHRRIDGRSRACSMPRVRPARGRRMAACTRRGSSSSSPITGPATSQCCRSRPTAWLSEAVDVKQDDGPHGETRPAEGPPGNFSISDHDGPHAHMIASDPTGRFVIVNDLGLDRTFVWKLDDATGQARGQRSALHPRRLGRRRPAAFRFPSERARFSTTSTRKRASSSSMTGTPTPPPPR